MSYQENRLVRYVIDSKRELKKVTWPTKKETTKHTLIIIGVSLGTAVFLGVLDLVFSKIVAALL